MFYIPAYITTTVEAKSLYDVQLCIVLGAIFPHSNYWHLVFLKL